MYLYNSETQSTKQEFHNASNGFILSEVFHGIL